MNGLSLVRLIGISLFDPPPGPFLYHSICALATRPLPADTIRKPTSIMCRARQHAGSGNRDDGRQECEAEESGNELPSLVRGEMQCSGRGHPTSAVSVSASAMVASSESDVSPKLPGPYPCPLNGM